MNLKNFLTILIILLFCIQVKAISAPTNLKAIAKNQAIELTWTKNTEPSFSHYKLFYGLNSKKYTEFIELPVNKFIVSGLQNGKTYYFAIKAIDLNGNESDYSNEVSATPREEAPFAPTNLRAEIFDNTVKLTWEHSQKENFSHYKINFGVNASNLVLSRITTDKNFSFVNLKPNTNYYFIVTAIDKNKRKSPPSNKISVLTPQIKCKTEKDGKCNESCAEVDPDCKNRTAFDFNLDFEWILNFIIGIILLIAAFILAAKFLEKQQKEEIETK